MTSRLGIRREDKNKWERRVPLIPDDVKILKEKYGIETVIQPSPIRVFSDEEYNNIGAIVQEDLSSCPVVFAVKEIPKTFFEPNKVYVFFSHTIKGQSYNMPMLKQMIDLECTLIDYERIVDENNRRLIFFGRFAGIAGIIDTLWVFGKRLKEYHGVDSPFSLIKQAYQYGTISEVKKHFEIISEEIRKQSLPAIITPMVIGIAGYGNVSRGVQEILDILPVVEIQPEELSSIYEKPSNDRIYKVVFKEEHMVEPISKDRKFDLNDYYTNPEEYQSSFNRYLPYLDILMNCIYWDPRYPRLVTKKDLKELDHHLHIIGDISVDIEGAIEATAKVTTPDDPVFTYNPKEDKIVDGYMNEGVVIMAIDNLPCELPEDSSREFSKALLPFVSSIVNADYTVPFDKLDLPSEIKKAVVLYQGKLTPSYEYIHKFL
ncbi:MAG: hypothetical protein DRN12_04915 [Thermoplasmata archaeon]|nr:MAG: hypothetical protein DRN12_04915 [Thermoplasmata archaeon]